MLLDEVIGKTRVAMVEASELARQTEPNTDEHDHLMQAHFRLTEALAHLRVARGAIDARSALSAEPSASSSSPK